MTINLTEAFSMDSTLDTIGYEDFLRLGLPHGKVEVQDFTKPEHPTKIFSLKKEIKRATSDLVRKDNRV